MITAHDLYQKLRHIKLGGTTCVYTPEKCESMAPIINQINTLKKQKNAIILAHSYVSPEIVTGVADFVGDSYELSKKAKETQADIVVFAAVKFMAETAKLLNPDKEVLVPSAFNGCSLADSITGADVKTLRAQFPDYTFVCYINTTADVKAECDVCVTSSNVYNIVEKIQNDKIYFLPDRLMGKNLQIEMEKRGVQKTIRWSEGTCYVHEEYDADLITYLRGAYPGVRVVSHPECNDGVIKASDYVGSTSQMVNYVKQTDASPFFLLTECGLTQRLQLEVPDKKFVGSCTLCKYMKSNSLEDILRVLQNPQAEDRVLIEADTAKRAGRCIERMFEFNN